MPREDVEAIKPSTTSMMPEGQLEPLSPQEIRDLFAYLASPSQVPLPTEGRRRRHRADNAWRTNNREGSRCCDRVAV